MKKDKKIEGLIKESENACSSLRSILQCGRPADAVHYADFGSAKKSAFLFPDNAVRLPVGFSHMQFTSALSVPRRTEFRVFSKIDVTFKP